MDLENQTVGRKKMYRVLLSLMIIVSLAFASGCKEKAPESPKREVQPGKRIPKGENADAPK
jgi:hypothetical protein